MRSLPRIFKGRTVENHTQPGQAEVQPSWPPREQRGGVVGIFHWSSPSAEFCLPRRLEEEGSETDF